MVSGGHLPLYQCQGALGSGEGASSLPVFGLWLYGVDLHRQLHVGGLSPEVRGYSVSCSQLHRQEDSLLGGDSPYCSGPSVHHGSEQCVSRCPVQAQPDSGLRMDTQEGDFQQAPQAVASDGGPVRHSANHCCSLYFLPFHNPQALGMDILLHSWDGLLVYALPPWALIPQVLRKLRASSRILTTLVAPHWPQRSWFPELLDLAVDRPVAVPLCPDLLKQPHFHCRHLRIRRLSLHAWRLSSDLPGVRDSPPE